MVEDHPKHHRLLLLLAVDIEPNQRPICSGYNKSICCDVTAIVCPSCQRHFQRTCSRHTRSQKRIQSIVCLFCPGGAAALPLTTTVNSTSILWHRCLLCHATIWLDFHAIMCQQCPNVAHRKCSGISRYVTNPFWLCPVCCLPMWGWHSSDRLQIYIAVERSILEHAAAAWAPCLSATTSSTVFRGMPCSWKCSGKMSHRT